MWKKVTFAAAVSLMAAAGTANAGPVSADFTETLAIPTLSPALGPRVFSAPGRGILPRSGAAPYELGAGDEDQNPSNFNGFIEVDVEPDFAPSIPNTITFFHRETNTGYQSIRITISDIRFDEDDEFIAGVTLNSGSIIDELNSDPFTETVLFTDDSITFIFEVEDMSPGQILHLVAGGSAQYLLDIRTRTTTVSEPASLALVGAALAGFGLFGRRKRKAASPR
jgi:PEP-CTERM motif